MHIYSDYIASLCECQNEDQRVKHLQKFPRQRSLQIKFTETNLHRKLLSLPSGKTTILMYNFFQRINKLL